MNPVDDKKGSEISITKLTVLSEHYAVVCPPIARFYMFEAEAIKSKQSIPSKQVSQQMCQYCCSLWRPFNCTVSQGRQKQKNKITKLQKKRQEGRRLNDVEVKILSSIKSRIIVRCHACKGKTALPMKSNQCQNPFKHSTRKKLTHVDNVKCDSKLNKQSLSSSRSADTVNGSLKLSSKGSILNDSNTRSFKQLKHQPNFSTPQAGKKSKPNSSTPLTEKHQYKPNALTPFIRKSEQFKLNSCTQSSSKLKSNSNTSTPMSDKVKNKKHNHLKEMLSRAAADRKTASPSNLKSFIDFCRS